ncbi:FAD binding domain-containing protein [Ramlibacter tataouinensis]|uniref:Candidate xanthine dehydrogenase yagS, FAD binding subunit n=1 Tax=Ramlibacter tataouinensis (strain ATCC BAA-407 / DSM 14655 / LMG 21543 / TTB310) TaxID=365046 RepID=F5XVH7_RAMTT|nr:xanthine dehydrogenase family protein subunit M [Ramlibacter tataouinensis]AEG91553.1 Candidate xanthine dehydrogenase yagS, FAD binding subunit [Ramlibacter tataouinensis TTB310]
MRAASDAAAETPVRAPVQYLAGGTTLVDLMKLDVMRPAQLVDITRLQAPGLHSIEAGRDGLRIGALATMRQVADHPAVRRDYPVLSDAMWLAASPQIRNMARTGGNVLQRTRCAYFRDISWPCNKREPGSGCSALEGQNRWHAVLGTSESCIASYPGDWATALVALDATVHTLAPRGARSLPFARLHRLPGQTPHIETVLAPGELITGFSVPAAPFMRRSLYLKVRDRESYEFALASAAVALDLDGETVRQVRIGLGGPVAVPWRAREAEAALAGRPLTEANALAAARAAFAGARPREHNAFRIPLGEQTLVRALMQAKTMEVAS